MSSMSKDKSSIISYIFCVFTITSEKGSNIRLKELHLWYFSVVKCQRFDLVYQISVCEGLNCGKRCYFLSVLMQ